MFACLFFGLVLLGLFSIIENIKSGQKLSYFKLHIILFLTFLTLISLIDFLYEFGFDCRIIQPLIREIGIFIFINWFFLIAKNSIPKILLYFEGFILLVYFYLALNGIELAGIFKGQLTMEVTSFNIITFFFNTFFALIVVSNNLLFIYLNTSAKNLYQAKIRKWVFLLVLIVIVILSLISFSILIYYKMITSSLIDTRSAFIAIRFILIIFVLIRPRFLDESGYTSNFYFVKPSAHSLTFTNFEFLFFGNMYYLNVNANLDDFSLKLNKSKSEVDFFIRSHFKESFNELLNKNRVTYFKELLKSNQNESFTIEALSEMAGFSNRQSMYNAFKKYEGCTPSNYINNL